jgi:hypothetical protein
MATTDRGPRAGGREMVISPSRSICFQGLQELTDDRVRGRVCPALLLQLGNGVHYGCVVHTAEIASDLRYRRVREQLCQIHGDLSRHRHTARPDRSATARWIASIVVLRTSASPAFIKMDDKPFGGRNLLLFGPIMGSVWPGVHDFASKRRELLPGWWPTLVTPTGMHRGTAQWRMFSGVRCQSGA